MTDPEVTLGDTPLTVKKFAYTVPISCCLASEHGIGTCDHPKPPPLTRRQRFRLWRARIWDRRPRIHLGPCNHDDCEW